MKLTVGTDGAPGTHDGVVTYAMEIRGSINHVGGNAHSDVLLEIAQDWWVVTGSLNGDTDVWQIDGTLEQFKIGGSDLYWADVDGTPVNADLLGENTVPLTPPTGGTAGLTEYELHCGGASNTNEGSFLLLINGELLAIEDAGDLGIEIASGWYTLHGHIAGGLDTHRFAGRVVDVSTEGGAMWVELDGTRLSSWDQLVQETGGDQITQPPGDGTTDDGGDTSPEIETAIWIAAGVSVAILFDSFTDSD